ncbi:hypothetical protein PMAYCL1PPCAC_19030 [Pristionchus mayeri]|uniref:G-protein coupled receptors family 1 profile domain-containing protein n=1 Tax=Pristionchus mayeri TaxID=1317129 RepID=A0AAN5CR09_9BILA|nr:hypothetical protein PMAYCL1PPCAC_19030 [Pristionchus mayeri]
MQHANFTSLLAEVVAKHLGMKMVNGCKEKRSIECEDNAFHIGLMGYGFMPILFLAIVGNALNVMIYSANQMKHFLAIRMLCVRLAINTFAVLVLLPSALRMLNLWDHFGEFDELYYWRYYKWQLFGGNTLGFCSMWLTVLMTLECFVHIFHPLRSKQICTMRNLWIAGFFIVAFGSLLAAIYPANRHAFVHEDSCGKFVTIDSQTDDYWTLLERLHTIATLFIALLTPIIVMIYMCVRIVLRINRDTSIDTNSSKRHFNAEKRCVTRITLITTLLQFMEIPSVIVFIKYSWQGPDGHNDCTLHTLCLFLGLCNMSLSFFVYFIFSPKFRSMVTDRWLEFSEKILPMWCVNSFLRPNTPNTQKMKMTLLYHNGEIQTDFTTRGTTAEDTFL